MDSFWIASGESRLFCRKTGKGVPVLMIHGACVDGDFFYDTAQYLSRFYQVCMYDRCGYGRSEDAGYSDYSVEYQTENAARVAEALGSPCHVIAHSAGTTIAMELAAKHPKLVRSVILHEPIDADTIEPGGTEEQNLTEISELIHRGKLNSAMNRFLPRLGDRDERARPATEGELSRMSKNCSCFIRNEFDIMFQYASDGESLKGIPITIGVGERSQNTARWETAVKLARKLNAPITYFPGGHNCPFDLPREFAYLCAGILSER